MVCSRIIGLLCIPVSPDIAVGFFLACILGCFVFKDLIFLTSSFQFY